MRNENRLFYAPQIEALAARQYRDGNLADLCRRENEFYVRWRFLERLQKRVERALGQHVDLVDEEDFGARDKRIILRALDDLADVVDAGVGGSIHLEHVRMTPFHDLGAVASQHRHVDGRAINAGGFVVQCTR